MQQACTIKIQDYRLLVYDIVANTVKKTPIFVHTPTSVSADVSLI